jgi:hypothetical protein
MTRLKAPRPTYIQIRIRRRFNPHELKALTLKCSRGVRSSARTPPDTRNGVSFNQAETMASPRVVCPVIGSSIRADLMTGTSESGGRRFQGQPPESTLDGAHKINTRQSLSFTFRTDYIPNFRASAPWRFFRFDRPAAPF